MLKKILIASGAVWLIVAMYVLFVRGEVASVLPFGVTVALVIAASLKGDARDPMVSPMSHEALLEYLPTWKELVTLIALVIGAILYAISFSHFAYFAIYFGLTFFFLWLIWYSYPTQEIKEEAAVKLGPEGC